MEFKNHGELAMLAHQVGAVSNMRHELEKIRNANPIKQVQLAKAAAPKIIELLKDTEKALQQAYNNWPVREQVITINGREGFKWQVKL